jgi:hypothetical protein
MLLNWRNLQFLKFYFKNIFTLFLTFNFGLIFILSQFFSVKQIFIKYLISSRKCTRDWAIEKAKAAPPPLKTSILYCKGERCRVLCHKVGAVTMVCTWYYALQRGTEIRAGVFTIAAHQNYVSHFLFMYFIHLFLLAYINITKGFIIIFYICL